MEGDGYETLDGNPHLEIRPLAPRLRFRRLLPLSERASASWLRDEIRRYTGQVQADIRALPEYARRLAVMYGVTYETAGHPRYLSSLVAGHHHRRPSAEAAYHPDLRRISTLATLHGSPDLVSSSTPIRHETAHALTHISALLGGSLGSRNSLDWMPFLRTAYERDLARLGPDPERRYGMDLQHYLPSTHARGGHPSALPTLNDPHWGARREAFAEAWDIIVNGGNSAVNRILPEYTDTFRRMFPNMMAAVERIHRDLTALSAQHTDNEDFRAAARTYFAGLSSTVPPTLANLPDIPRPLAPAPQ